MNGATATVKSRKPVRQSVLSRRREPKSSLFRLCLGPEGRMFVDLWGRAPGRGIYVAAEELRVALSPKSTARIFKGKVQGLDGSAIDQLIADLLQGMTQRVKELVGLARRAGRLEAGSEAVLRRIEYDPKGWLVLMAMDFSERSVRRIAEAVDRFQGVRYQVALSAAELGHTLGRDVVGVVGIGDVSIAAAIECEMQRIAALSRNRESTPAAGRPLHRRKMDQAERVPRVGREPGGLSVERAGQTAEEETRNNDR